MSLAASFLVASFPFASLTFKGALTNDQDVNDPRTIKPSTHLLHGVLR